MIRLIPQGRNFRCKEDQLNGGAAVPARNVNYERRDGNQLSWQDVTCNKMLNPFDSLNVEALYHLDL